MLRRKFKGSIYSASPRKQLEPVHPEALFVARQSGGVRLGNTRGLAECTASRGGLVAFVLSLSDGAASVMGITSHVKALKFADWDPHGGHQVL
ncbi:hypothetical protein SKAU_G00415250 [Synaphobranchus kaupii]|uniref:Uncharacterized protein n=1 Tax=Synaphobranchus kaupii TaxID=118154 RepID=A0A9Q1E7C2_SYNKA|nr:hypothetical protein SKAU_G00415250 [Synaphobranchus kaupii]